MSKPEKFPWESSVGDSRYRYLSAESSLEILIETQVDLDGLGLEGAIARLRESAEGLSHPKVTVDVEYGTYGDRDRDITKVTGWRMATPQERTAMKIIQREQASNQLAYERIQLEAMRRAHPEWLKDGI